MTNTLNKIMHNGDEYEIPSYTAGTGLALNGTEFSNSGVTSVNGSTGDVTGLLTAETVVSGDSGVTYTIKVANSDPTSGTPSNIITLVP